MRDLTEEEEDDSDHFESPNSKGTSLKRKFSQPTFIKRMSLPPNLSRSTKLYKEGSCEAQSDFSRKRYFKTPERIFFED